MTQSAPYPTPLATPPGQSQTNLVAQGFIPSEIHVLSSTRAVIGNRITPATIVVSKVSGKIIEVYERVLTQSQILSGASYSDYSPRILIPGLVDAHVHLNEPGRTQWEGFYHGTRAAASGGVTTVIDMPLNAIPPTTTAEGFTAKLNAASAQCYVDVGFYGGIIPGNTSELKQLVRMGVCGFKGFLCDSGVEEFPAVSSLDIEMAMRELSDEKTVLMFHAEMIPPISDSVGDDVQVSLPPLSPSGPLDCYQTFLDSRPPVFETCAIDEIVEIAHRTPHPPLHIVHLSAIEAIPILRQARAHGLKITAETCYHYLSLKSENVASGDTRHKCCPPIRTSRNQEGLWTELMKEKINGPGQGVISTVVSDHSPCTPDLKLLPVNLRRDDSSADVQNMGDFFSAWGGVSSVGLGLSIMWTESTQRGFDIVDLTKWCAVNTARQVGLSHRKGEIKVGMDADIVVFDDEASFVVQPSTMLFRNKCSPYEGKTLRGLVDQTWVRGRLAYDRLKGFTDQAFGEQLVEVRKV